MNVRVKSCLRRRTFRERGGTGVRRGFPSDFSNVCGGKKRLTYRGGAETIEDFGKNAGDFGSFASFDFAPMEHEDGLAVLEERHGGRGGREVGEARAEVGDGGFVSAGEDGGNLGGSGGVLEGDADAGASFAGGASADG